MKMAVISYVNFRSSSTPKSSICSRAQEGSLLNLNIGDFIWVKAIGHTISKVFEAMDVPSHVS